MDLEAALAISARSMDLQAARLRDVAETLARQEDWAARPVAGVRRRRTGTSGHPDVIGPPTPGVASMVLERGGGVSVDGTRDCLAANLKMLQATRTILSRTVEALR